MTKKILIVDFDLSSIDQLRNMLDDEVFDVSTATSGEMAWDMLTAQHFDLVISEIVLPRLHGFQLAKAVADELPHCRSLIVSGVFKGDIYQNQALQEYEAGDYLEKPLDKIQLKKSVAALLDIPEEELSGIAPQVIEEIVEDEVEEPVEELAVESTDEVGEPVAEDEPVEDPVEDAVDDDADVEMVEPSSEEVIEEAADDAMEEGDIETEEEVVEEDEITIEFSEHSSVLDEPEPQPEPVLETEFIVEPESEVKASEKIQKPQPSPSRKGMDIDAALDAVKKGKAETGDYKKIDSEISKKIEDVLSDLGLKK